MALNFTLAGRDVLRTCNNLMLKATICHKSLLPEKKVYHWPYEKHAWNYVTFFFDPLTKKKFNENSRIIQLEGNIGSGKSELGPKLAEQLGMKWFPQPDIEPIFINSHGFDHRALNPQLPERLRMCDMKMFHQNPSRHSVIHFLHNMYLLRLEAYMNALSHIFNTGQGVILERSVFTELALVEAMQKVGWLPIGHLRADGARFYDWLNRYKFIRACTLTYMVQPHLTIYLDVPPEVCKERLDKSPDPMIANSKALTLPYLEAIKERYENNMLPRTEYYGHLYRLDNYHENTFSLDDRVLDIIEDISTMDFDTTEVVGHKFNTWCDQKNGWHFSIRKATTSEEAFDIYRLADQSWYDIAGLGDSITQADLILRRSLKENHVIGHFRQIEDDTEHSSLLKVMFNHKPFRTSIRRALFADYQTHV